MTRHGFNIHRHEPSRRQRTGYTLLELLIASVLIVVLMTAVWNLMTMYSGFLAAGRSQAMEQQLVRSLLDLLATDIGSIAPEEPPKAETDAASYLDSKAQTENRAIAPAVSNDYARGFSSTPTTPSSEGAEPLPDFAMRGGGQTLTLIVTQATPHVRDMPQDDDWATPAVDVPVDGVEDSFGLAGDRPSAAVPRAADWKQVVYHFEPPRAVDSDDRALAPGLHRFAIPVESLGRLSELQSFENRSADAFDGMGDGFSAEAVEAIAALRGLGVASIDHEWIPEVVRCRFTYLTAAGWRSTWQADEHDDRPVAVRIQLGLLSSREHEQLMAALGSTDADERIAADEDVVAASAGALTQSDPFAAFQPRDYERMIVLHSRPDAARAGEHSRFESAPSDELFDSPFEGEP